MDFDIKDFGRRVAATYGDPNSFSLVVFGTPLHAGQRKYALNANADTNFLLPGNSWGKTEFLLRFALYLAYHKISPNRPTTIKEFLAFQYKGLIASYAYPIAKESFDRFLNYYNNRQEVRALVASVARTDPPRVTLSNGSIIDWGSLDGQGKLVEAARRNFIMVDEVGHIPDISETFDNILYPRTMGVSGRVHLFGTPKASSDPYLLEIYSKGLEGDDPFYYSQPGSVFENEFWTERERERVLRNPRYVKGWNTCPGCDGYELNDTVCMPQYGGHPILTTMGKQVLLGHFVLAGGYWFNREFVRRMFTGDYEVEWESEHRFSIPLEKTEKDGKVVLKAPSNRMYAAAFDLGGNKARKRKKPGSDPTVGFVVDYTDRPWKVVAYYYIEGGEANWEEKYELMRDVYETFHLPYLLIDATGQIDSVQEALYNRGVEVFGVQFGGNSNKKFDMLRNLQLLMEMEHEGQRGMLRSVLIPQLKHELDHYVIPDDKIKQDCVMALAMVAHHVALAETPASTGSELF